MSAAAMFEGAAAYYHRTPIPTTHNQRVCRLYRQGLKKLQSWCVDRGLFLDECTKLRARFEEQKGLDVNRDSALIKRLMREAREELETHTHPEPYVVPWYIGGSAFLRNPAIPLSVCYPLGIPEHVKKEVPFEINLDGSRVDPAVGPYGGLVDPARKIIVDKAEETWP